MHSMDYLDSEIERIDRCLKRLQAHLDRESEIIKESNDELGKPPHVEWAHNVTPIRYPKTRPVSQPASHGQQNP